MPICVSYSRPQGHLTRLEPATDGREKASSHNVLEGYLTGLELATTGTTRAKDTDTRVRSESASFSLWNGAADSTHLISAGGRNEFSSSPHNRQKKEIEMNNAHNYTARPVVAIPRNPTIEDAQAFMEFLAEKHPQLHEAMDAVERAHRVRGVDLSPDRQTPEESDGA